MTDPLQMLLYVLALVRYSARRYHRLLEYLEAYLAAEVVRYFSLLLIFGNVKEKKDKRLTNFTKKMLINFFVQLFTKSQY